MKSFQYTAKNDQGEQVTGVIKSDQFEDASNQVRSRGLELISLEEVEKNIIGTLRPFVFEALDSDGEEVQGTLNGPDAASVTQQLEDEFGLQPTSVQERKDESRAHSDETIQVPVLDEDNPTEEATELSSKQQHEEPILFGKSPELESKQVKKSASQLDSIEKEIDTLLKEKGAGLSEVTRERLLHLAGKINLLRESPDKKRLKNFKREIKKAKKIAERELKEVDQEKWEQYEEQAPGESVGSYAEFEQERKQQKMAKLKTSKFSKWLQVIDVPNEDREEEVLVKQQYESVWNEVQRFTAALFAFYLAAFFLAYYLKRAGVEDHFLVRIFDTTLFKQLVLVLFGLFALLTLRVGFLPKRIKGDAAIIIIWLFSVWWVFW